MVSGWLVGDDSKVSLSPNVPLSPSRETKQEAGGCVVAVAGYLYFRNRVPFNGVQPDGGFVVVGYLYVGNHVPFNDVPTDGGFVVAKTVKTISSVICQYSYETREKD